MLTDLQADLVQDGLTRYKFGTYTDYKTKHRYTAIPGFSKIHETEAGLSVFSHVLLPKTLNELRFFA
tara:strand:+ start:257 stop:457 length:201 start_codon:yes stop_codon:yes gene_type:complete